MPRSRLPGHEAASGPEATRSPTSPAPAPTPTPTPTPGPAHASPSPVRAADAARPARAEPPETLEGWYALHQAWRVDRRAVRRLSEVERHAVAREAIETLEGLSTPRALPGVDDGTDGPGWTAVAELTGSAADVLVVQFRPTLDRLGAAQRALGAAQLAEYLVPVRSFLSVTEAGLYHITAAVAAAR